MLGSAPKEMYVELEKTEQFLTQTFGDNDSFVFRDLSLNFKKIMEDSPLDPTDRWRNVLAISQSLSWTVVKGLATLAH